MATEDRTEERSEGGLREWLSSQQASSTLTDLQRRRAVAWIQASPDTDLEGAPDAPFRPLGTPRREFHARLLTHVSDVADGRPGWRPPSERLQSHFFGQQRDPKHPRNWTRGYDDPLVRSPGGHDFGYLPSGGPLDYNDDFLDVIKEHLIAVHARIVVDEDGFRVGVMDDDVSFAIHEALAFCPWELERQVSCRLRLWELDADSYRQNLMRGSVIWDSVDALLKAGVSEAAAWALCTYTRPDLVPMPDRVVAELLGLRADEDSKPYWWWALRTDPDLLSRLETLRVESGVEYLQLLRLAEILVLVRESDRRHHVATLTDLAI